MKSQINSTLHPAKIWTDIHSLESSAIEQIKNTANLPWVHKHVAIMPDAHTGYGVAIGTVLPLNGAVSPSAVGVDLGCGMIAVKTNLTLNDLPESLRDIRIDVEWAIPTGRYTHKSCKNDTAMEGFNNLFAKVRKPDIVANQVGTLGGGNHFVELCSDQDGFIWLTLHSGSRGVGKIIADHHIKIAKTLEHNFSLPDPELAVFLSGTKEMSEYRKDVSWAQRYASINRKTMLDLYKKSIRSFFPHVKFESEINCHHNYVEEEVHFGEKVFVTRKGAISARQGELGIIPGSMGTGSYIVSGLGNPESFYSASHGAGRVMSRGVARRSFTVEDLELQTSGVECRKDSGILDEIPGAYKNIDEVIENEKDLVSVVARLDTLMCIKG